MASAVETISSREIECRKICIERFVYAILYSVGAQFVLLTVFLLLVNLSLLHPITWIAGSFRLVFSLSTWLWIMPLISAVIIHGMFLAKSYLSEIKYCPTRFQQLYRTFKQKSILLSVNCVVGFLTAWLYTRFLRDEYRVLFLPSEKGTFILNEKYLFLLVGGTFAGIYYFLKTKNDEYSLNFPPIQQPRYLQIRAHLYSIVYQSMFKSFVPTLVYVSFHYTFSCVYFRYKLAALFYGVKLAEESSFTSLYSTVADIRMMLYCWILSSQILSNMSLIQMLFHIFLTECRQFPLEKSAMVDDSAVSIVEALASDKIPIIQQLAALHLFNISEDCDPAGRVPLYALSIPGGHPYNWRMVSGECIRLIREFSTELSKSIEGVAPKMRPEMSRLRPTASMDAEKTIMKQYNESFGIRSLSTNGLPADSPQQSGTMCKAIDRRLDSFRATLRSIPGIFYLFGESKTAKTCYLLSTQSNQIVWTSQALASLAARSITEDQFGVVQSDLPLIIRTLLQLKQVLDKVGSIQLDVKKIDRNYVALRAATKRSLYRISYAFADYLNDIVLEPSDVEAMHGFVNYREA
ncbi:nucleoporin Ndc1 [Toxorhynchites rutilus septentrionalis]|uniref:nucleoporin Ndc1 n=1 Tax=Toxorhynchites rutilus septentrionalis TaxID=329112 RepID=UPI0024796469|nr:nucleoporin Ndc1 [Toxorhynchites rutilus septentrionalis]